MKLGPVRVAALSLALVALAGGLGLAERRDRPAPAAEVAAKPIEIQAEPFDAFDPRDASRRQFGALQFRGGLVLKSSTKDFGGLSALRIAPGGERFLALSDRAMWLRGRIAYRDERPAAIVDAEMAPILGPDGRPLYRRGWYDTEALAVAEDAIYVGIERVHEIVRFDHRGLTTLPGRSQPIVVPPAMKTLPANKGIECLEAPAKGLPHAGALIAISERGLDRAGNIIGFVIGPSAAAFSVKRSDEFDISDCAITPRGDLLVLERRFSWTRGVAIRIRRLALSAFASNAVLDGPELFFADLGYQIDNMEGLAVHRAANGALVLTMVSDDNFSVFQRTLLLQFTLLEE